MIKETFFGSQGVCVFLKYDRLNCVPENVRFPLDSTFLLRKFPYGKFAYSNASLLQCDLRLLGTFRKFKRYWNTKTSTRQASNLISHFLR